MSMTNEDDGWLEAAYEDRVLVDEEPFDLDEYDPLFDDDPVACRDAFLKEYNANPDDGWD